MRKMRGAHWSAFALMAIACSEHFPRVLEAGQAAAPPVSAYGLDVRPLNATCIAGPRPTTALTLVGFEKVTSAVFNRPVEIALNAGKLYVVEQGGRVLRLNDDGATTSLVVDLTSKTLSGGEAGLLGIAFHPKFAQNGFVYVYHTVPHPTQPPPTDVVFQSALERYHSADGGLTIDAASEKRILTIDQPYSNHNGGTIAFGNDGLLYWGLGDGGSGGDPKGRAQNKDELLGKMLRIDVDGAEPYTVPPSNPFAAGGGRPEIFALGLRNPFRFRFDPLTGELWAGDVGQGAREEIDKIVLGGNYGWNIREGKTCYAPVAGTCATAGLIDPVVDHGRDEATTITGGVVYRGAGVPLLSGRYVYADFGLGTFWSIPIELPAPIPQRLDEGLPRLNPSAFATDAAGEIVFTEYTSGSVYRIVAGGKAVPEIPELLSATGCVDKADPTKPAAGLFPYDVNVPQWIDGASAERYLSLPAGSALRTAPGGRLAPPPGSIIMKTLREAPTSGATLRRIETQLLVARPDAVWDAYTYVWNDAQTDATLAVTPVTLTLPSGRKHAIVDRQACLACHSLDGTPTIGLEAAQLDRDDVDYGSGRLANPLTTLEHLGMLDTAVPRDTYSPLPGGSGFQTAERRARGYLHANCANCHRGGETALDLRFGTRFADMHACNVSGGSKVGGRVRIAPRAPDESQLVRVMRATNQDRMPPIATVLPDDDAIRVVSSWIEGIAGCD